jgi:Protein of unknown function (DUF3800)
LYNIYIDESGDEGFYPIEQLPTVIGGSSRFFSLGGIIVDERDNYSFKKDLDSIISDFFNGITLPQDFELHYFDLRAGRSPFHLLNREDRLAIADRVFSIIKSRDCKLVSITIDLLKHYAKYSKPYTPRSYALFLIQERFQYFLEDHNETGYAIYEGYVSRVQKSVALFHKHFHTNPSFPKFTDFKNITHETRNGNPLLEPILQMADFFANIPWIKCTSKEKKVRRWNEIKHKYYNLDHQLAVKRGNYEI